MNKNNETSEYVPSVQFQNGESVRLRLGHHTNLPCRILATKMTAKFVYYDLEVWIYPAAGDGSDPVYTRLYHVESKWIFEREPIENVPPVEGAGSLDNIHPALHPLLDAMRPK